MATFAGALGRGLAGYAQNRERADARDADLAQQQRAEARQAMLDERQRVQMEAQAQAMKEQRERQQRMDDRQAEGDRNNAIDNGLRDTEPTRQMGTLMSGAANVGVGSTGAMLGALGSYGKAAQSAAESPTQYSVGGKPMVKAAESLAERTARMGVEQRRGERMADNEFTMNRDEANDTRTMNRDAQNQSFQLRRDANNNAAQMAAAGARQAAQPPAKLRVVSSGAMKDYQGIESNLRELKEIEASLGGDPKTASEALGLKNMLPEWVATRGMSDPALTLRGKLSNVTSGIFLERSGAAVTPSEAKRLEGWTANLTDNPAKALNAIRNMRAFYEQKVADMQNAYGEGTGYHPLTPAQKVPDVRSDRPPTSAMPDMSDPGFQQFLAQRKRTP